MIITHNAAPNARLIKQMSALRAIIYQANPHHCAPAEGALEAELNRDAFKGLQRIFIAEENGRALAHVVARISPGLGERDAPLGMLGNFEALDRAEVVARLLQCAIQWLQSRGAEQIIGPINGDTWHAYRFNIGPSKHAPFLKEPYNPTYYSRLWSEAGFEVDATYHSRHVPNARLARDAQLAKSEAAHAAGYRFQTIDLSRFGDELDRLYAMTQKIFAGAYLYNGITRAEFGRLYEDARALVDPDLVIFALAPNGSDVGFTFAFPDRFHGVAAMKGRRNMRAKARFLLHRDTDTVNIKTVGVMPQHRGQGLASAMAYEVYHKMLPKGFERANLCLMVDGNPSSGLCGGTSKVSRRYALYRWNGGDS